ncbi:MAG: hypothetical protein H7281_14055 [Bacteriovorax sp.]|nr:hypothetical protein [Bacteriovorax sp.]
MKPNLLLLLTLLISNLANSAGPAKTDTSKQVYGGVSIKEDSALKKLLEIPQIAVQYKSCQLAFPTLDQLDKISDCLWNGDGDKIPALNPAQKDEVKKIYAQEDSGGPSKDKVAVDPKAAEIDVTSTKVKSTTSLTNRNLTVGTDYKSDPAVKVLSAFFGKKLDEVLNGSTQDKKDKKIITVDHTEFIDLYTSELGKSIVNAFTSYCMETSPSCRDLKKDPADGVEKYSKPCIISKNEIDRKADIASNLKTINAANFTDAEGLAWQHCIGSVSGVCYENTSTDLDLAYSKQKACLVMDFVKSARKNLIIADQQKIFYNGLKGGGDKGIASIASNMKAANEKDLTADKLTQINSADIDKPFTNSDNLKENISTTNKKLVDESKDCVGPDGLVTTKDKCSKFLDVNTTKNTDAVAEFGLRQFAKADDLDKKLENKDTVGSYLKEEGYTEDQIKSLTSADKIEEVKLKIKERFNSEKDAIIKEMASRVSAKTTATNGAIDKDKDLSPLTKIKEELGSRNEDLKNLIHFNNIVASYLTISELNADGTTKKGTSPTRNTASLFAEVKSMDDQKESKVIMDKIKNNKDLKDGQTSPEFKIDDINKLLKYTEDQKVPAQNP